MPIASLSEACYKLRGGKFHCWLCKNDRNYVLKQHYVRHLGKKHLIPTPDEDHHNKMWQYAMAKKEIGTAYFTARKVEAQGNKVAQSSTNPSEVQENIEEQSLINMVEDGRDKIIDEINGARIEMEQDLADVSGVKILSNELVSAANILDQAYQEIIVPVYEEEEEIGKILNSICQLDQTNRICILQRSLCH